MLSAAVFAAAASPTYHQTKKIVIGGEGGWDYLTFDGMSRHLYVSRSTRVQVIDVDKGVLVGEIPNTEGVHGIALAGRTHRGFTSNGRSNSVTVFDTETLKEVGRVNVGKNPDAIIFDRASNRIFTFNGGSSDATAIDVDTLKVAGTIPLGGRPEFGASDGAGKVFVNIEDKSEIVAIDSKALTVKNRWSLAPGDSPTGLAVDARNHRLFSVCGNEKMIVMDSETGKIIATPTIGKRPDAAAFDGRASLAFSSNGEGTVTVISEESPDKFTVVQTLQTQMGARTMALDRRTGEIFLAAAQYAPAPAGTNNPRQRPAILPNSFVILVFGK